MAPGRPAAAPAAVAASACSCCCCCCCVGRERGLQSAANIGQREKRAAVSISMSECDRERVSEGGNDDDDFLRSIRAVYTYICAALLRLLVVGNAPLYPSLYLSGSCSYQLAKWRMVSRSLVTYCCCDGLCCLGCC